MPERRTAPGIPPPLKLGREYARQIHELLDSLTDPVDARIRQGGHDWDIVKREILGSLKDQGIPAREAARRVAELSLATMNDWQLARFNKIMGRRLGVTLFPYDNPAIKDFLRFAVELNTDLIVTINERYVQDIAKAIDKTLAEAPFDQQRLRSEVMRAQAKGITERAHKNRDYNIRRITRDQTNKTIGQLNAFRQKEVGINEYYWRTAMDERVRRTHDENEGEKFSWDAPPITGHPGEDIQCRCVAEPILPS